MKVVDIVLYLGGLASLLGVVFIKIVDTYFLAHY